MLDGGPECPADGEHVWAWFIRLSAARGGNGFSANEIKYTEMAAWVWLTGTIIRPAEIDAIVALDQTWLAAQAKAAKLKVK
jgi:hypothetical protein